MRRYVIAIVIGALLAAVTVGLLGSLWPVTGPPSLSRNLWADYLGLAGATGLSAMAVYGITAFCIWLCLVVAGLLRRCRHGRPAAASAPVPETEEDLWLPS